MSTDLGSALETEEGLGAGWDVGQTAPLACLTFSCSILPRSPQGAYSWAKAKNRGVCRGPPRVCSRPGWEDTQRPTQNSLRKVALRTESRRRSLRATAGPARETGPEGRSGHSLVLGRDLGRTRSLSEPQTSCRVSPPVKRDGEAFPRTLPARPWPAVWGFMASPSLRVASVFSCIKGHGSGLIANQAALLPCCGTLSWPLGLAGPPPSQKTTEL